MTQEPTNATLADWIERGLATEGVRESRGTYIEKHVDGVCRACALGLAAIGKLGVVEADKLYSNREGFTGAMAEILGISLKLAIAIEDHHLSAGKMKTAAEIAAMLRRGEIGE